LLHPPSRGNLTKQAIFRGKETVIEIAQAVAQFRREVIQAIQHRLDFEIGTIISDIVDVVRASNGLS